jgi:hypothetical protein
LDFLTNAWVDWSDFLVAHWGQLEEGSFRWPLIQHGHYGSHLGFGSVDYLTNAYRLIRFFWCLIWVIFTMFHFSLNLIVHTPTDNVPISICHALRCPCFVF